MNNKHILHSICAIFLILSLTFITIAVHGLFVEEETSEIFAVERNYGSVVAKVLVIIFLILLSITSVLLLTLNKRGITFLYFEMFFLVIILFLASAAWFIPLVIIGTLALIDTLKSMKSGNKKLFT